MTRISCWCCLCVAAVVVVGCSRPVADHADSSAIPTKTSDASATEPRAPRFAFYTVDHYDPKRNAADDLAMTLKRAKQEHKRVLVQVGGDWCGWCKRMSEFIETNEPVRAAVEKNFLIMKVTKDDEQPNEAFLSQYPKINAYPHLFVLESDGTVLHSQDTAPLEEGEGYNEQVYLEFLEKWKEAG